MFYFWVSQGCPVTTERWIRSDPREDFIILFKVAIFFGCSIAKKHKKTLCRLQKFSSSFKYPLKPMFEWIKLACTDPIDLSRFSVVSFDWWQLSSTDLSHHLLLEILLTRGAGDWASNLLWHRCSTTVPFPSASGSWRICCLKGEKVLCGTGTGLL